MIDVLVNALVETTFVNVFNNFLQWQSVLMRVFITGFVPNIFCIIISDEINIISLYVC